MNGPESSIDQLDRIKRTASKPSLKTENLLSNLQILKLVSAFYGGLRISSLHLPSPLSIERDRQVEVL